MRAGLDIRAVTSMRLPAAAILTAAAFIALVFLSQGTVDANGRVAKFTSRTSGPYNVSLGTSPAEPLVGRLHLTIRLSEPGSEARIAGAEVVVTGVGPGATEPEIGPLSASPLPSTPEDYDFDVTVDREGTWVFFVDVDSPLGSASTDFSLEVSSTSPVFGFLALGLAMALLVIVGMSARRYLELRRRQRSGGR